MKEITFIERIVFYGMTMPIMLVLFIFLLLMSIGDYSRYLSSNRDSLMPKYLRTGKFEFLAPLSLAIVVLIMGICFSISFENGIIIK